MTRFGKRKKSKSFNHNISAAAAHLPPGDAAGAGACGAPAPGQFGLLDDGASFVVASCRSRRRRWGGAAGGGAAGTGTGSTPNRENATGGTAAANASTRAAKMDPAGAKPSSPNAGVSLGRICYGRRYRRAAVAVGPLSRAVQ